ncbi:DUF4259 domain-containing protein [Streptosporangium sp. NPDC020145]|uniref:DUF4259 domain-containing protein n=1 Tax=Streptosporangium jomthongense TaxID=1193683 RepID=A0ABV8EVN9_9ACTN
MGAWDLGPFDNDGALDLLAHLDGTADPAAALSEALREILDQDDYVEGPDMAGAVAMACLTIARLAGAESVALTDPVAVRWLEGNPFQVDAALRGLAADLLDRAARPGDNELYDLWQDADSLDEWLATLTPYRRALAG